LKPGISVNRSFALRFKMPAVARHGEAEREIDRRDKCIHFDAEGLPSGIDDRGLCRGEQVEDTDDQDEAGILEEGDEGVDQGRDAVPDRLRQYDQPVLLPIGEAERVGSFVLSSRYRL